MSLNAQIRTLRSVFVAMAGVQLAMAATGTMVPIAFAEIGASQEAASVAASAFSAGFLVGCFFVARFIANIGYIRAFTAATSIATAAALLFFLLSSPLVLILLRFLTGLATAALFSIGGAWINETAEQYTRGRVLAIYAIVTGIVSVFSQLLVFVVPDDIHGAFVLVALVYCVTIMVIATTRTNPPDTGSKATMRIKGVIREAPAAVAGIFAMGIVSTTILSVAPYNAAKLGIDYRDIALMIGAIYLGRVLFQYPLGLLSDTMDRRIVVFATSLICASVLLLVAILTDPDYVPEPFQYLSWGYFVLIALMISLGGTLLPLYSLLVAHALDRTEPQFVASSVVTMLFLWTIASVSGPLIANVFTAMYGDNALHWVNFVVMLIFVLFLALRIWFVEGVSRTDKTSHIDMDPTSTEISPSTKN